MITRVWGVVNSAKVEFTPIPEKPGYWEGYAPKARWVQELEIWAENHLGARGHLQCSLIIDEYTETEVRLILAPYRVALLDSYEITVLNPYTSAILKGGSWK